MLSSLDVIMLSMLHVTNTIIEYNESNPQFYFNSIDSIEVYVSMQVRIFQFVHKSEHIRSNPYN